MNGSATTRYYLSLRHIESAATFTRQSAAIEQDPAAHGDKDNDAEVYRLVSLRDGYVIAAILASVAFLEATINELFSTAAEGGDYFDLTYPPDTSHPDLRSDLESKWAEEKFRSKAPTLEKYDAALGFVGEKLDRGRGTYQDTIILTQLRNSLVHYFPETYPNPTQQLQKLETQLPSKLRGPLNPLCADLSKVPFFPDRCICRACAAWAVTTAIRFCDEFFGKLGVRSLYDHDRHYPRAEFDRRTKVG